MQGTLANDFNVYFTNEISILCTETLSIKNFDESFTNSTQILMESFSPIKLEDLHQTVLSMSHATAPHDLNRTVIFKKKEFSRTSICYYFNTCIGTGVFPDDLKKQL